MAEGIDYARLAQELMQVLSTGESLRGDQPYTSRDPGTKYRSGEVTSDVGMLDPIDMLAGMLASKGATLARRAGRALTEPGTRPARSALPELPESQSQAIRARVAEEFRLKRAAADAEEAAYLARRQREIDDEMQDRWRAYRSPFASGTPAEEAARIRALDDQIEARLQPYRSRSGASTPTPLNRRVVDMDAPASAPTGDAQQYADIIRKLFEQGG